MGTRSQGDTTTTLKPGNEEFGSRPYGLRLIPLVCAAAAISTTFLPAEFILSTIYNTQDFWTEVGRFRQRLWNDVLAITGTNTVILYGLIPVLISTVAYWSIGMLYILMDLYGKPAALRKYKIQPSTNEPVESKKLIKAMLQVLFNQTVVSIPVALMAGRLFEYRGIPDPRILPPFYVTVLQVIGCVFVEEFGFYYSHRIMHHKSLYKHFHKQHHEWTAPVSVVAIYCHPVEHIVANLCPVVLGVFVFGCHPATTWLWFFLANIFTVNEHSGYHLPFLPSAEAHDFHHFKFNNCYGVLGILDYLHGTDQAFKSVKAGKRHRVLTDFRSARQLYPDADKN